MGTVFLALSEGPAGFNKLKVVKVLRPDLASDPQFLEMFLDEARLSARLNHPNIVQTNEVGFDGQDYYIEMEYLDGQSLDAITRAAASKDGVPRTLLLWILAQVLAGLHSAHELCDLQGAPLHVVHRDVSPHNVFVTYDGAVKVLDFGIAKATTSSSETRTGVVKGKATYMAPEQAARRPVDRRADVFAVGVMLWEALARRRMWSGLSDGEIFARLGTTEIEHPRSVRPDVPEALDAICMRALAADPAARFATAAELQVALEDFLDTSNERVGARAGAKFVSELFADRRAAVRAEIEAQLSGVPSSPGAVAAVPVLGHSQLSRTTSDGLSASSTVSRARQEFPTRAEMQAPIAGEPPRSKRSMPTLAVIGGLVLVVGGGALAVARNAKPRAPPIASTSVESSDASAALTARGVCTSNAECSAAHGGARFICRRGDGGCAPLESEDCKAHADEADFANPDTIWIGSMFPLTGENAASYGTSNANAVLLGRHDFAVNSHGLPSRAHDGRTRPIGIISCDDAVAPTRAAHHLAAVARVPAVIGFGTSKVAVDLIATEFLPRRVLVVSSTNTSPAVTAISQPQGEPRLVWRTTYSVANTAEPIGTFVSTVIEPALRASGVVTDAKPMRVAVVRPDNPSGLGFLDGVYATLSFNGKSALRNADHFQALVAPEPGDAEKAARVVAQLLKFRPHVVLGWAGEEIDLVVRPLEAGWPREIEYRPRYVSPVVSGLDLFRFIGKSAERRRRFFAETTVSTTAANHRFVMHYNEVFADKVTLTQSPNSSYDALFVIAYAAYAADDAISGPSLARAFARLSSPGTRIDVGPSKIFDGFAALDRHENIDLVGSAASLDFDLRTGEAPSDQAILCVSIDESGAAADNIESGLVYDAVTKKFRGTMRCP